MNLIAGIDAEESIFASVGMPKSTLIVNEDLSFEFKGRKMPNYWWRFWLWFLLGWKWVEEDK